MARPITAHLPDADKTVSAHIAKRQKPLNVSINGVGTPVGNNVRVATTEEWNSQVDLIGVKNVVYVYSDHEYTEDGKPIPGFKVGDGLAYLIDAPFNDDLALRHIYNTGIHVTEEEKAFWNSKVTAYLDYENIENLVLSSDVYIPTAGGIIPLSANQISSSVEDGWNEGD